MNQAGEWKKFWDDKSRENISNHEYDRGSGPRGNRIEELSAQEMIEFVAPQSNEVIFDAGCGSGVNLLRLHPRAKRLIGMDYSEGAIHRCEERMRSEGVRNVQLMQGSITDVRLPDRSVDKILCMSVLQYLDDDQVRRAFREFARILTGDRILVLHVKNLWSLYLSTLRLAKRLKLLLGKSAKLEFVRPFGWYMNELAAAGYEVLDYNSFNVFNVDFMPRNLVVFLQGMELRNRHNTFFRSQFVRRHGSDLKIKARLTDPGASTNRLGAGVTSSGSN